MAAVCTRNRDVRNGENSPLSIYGLVKPLVLLGLVILAPRAVGMVYSRPVGGLSHAINAGSVPAPVTTSFAIPLLGLPAASGLTAGQISSVTSGTITVTGANWTVGALATTQYPYAIRISSGAASGYTFGITANTADTLTVSGGDPTLLGIVAGTSGDSFHLLPVDTLNSLFGSSTFMGGATPADADIVTLSAAVQTAYYYNTTLSRWVRTTGPTTDRGNTPIPLDSAISVTRKSSAMTLRFTGAVQTHRFCHVVGNSGSTYTHAGFPTDVTLGALSLQTSLAGWVSSSSASTADVLSVLVGAGYTSYFHNGTYWQRTTGPATNRDSIIIPAGIPILMFKQSAAAGISLFVRNPPFPH